MPLARNQFISFAHPLTRVWPQPVEKRQKERERANKGRHGRDRAGDVPQSNALVILANAQHQAIVDMRANNVLEDLQMQGPQLFPGLAAVIWYVEKVERNIVVVESFGESSCARLVILHAAYPHLVIVKR